MKTFLLLLLMSISTITQAFSQSELVTILQQPQNIQGNFVQQRYLKSLAKPISTSGQFTLMKTKGLLWQMQKPFATNLKVTAEGIKQWNGSAWVGEKQLGQARQIALFLGLLSGDISALSEQFEPQLIGDKTQWTLQLIPKSLIMKQIFTQIQLHGDTLVKEIELSETQGDRTIIQFSHLTINQPLTGFVQQSLE